MTDAALAAARADAAAAAARSAVDVRVVDDAAGCHTVSAVLDAVWRLPDQRSNVEPNLVRAIEHAGGYAALATRGGAAVGASVGFLSDRGLHSHVTAALADERGRGVGTALKLHQRVWALEHGLAAVTWTFDPLVARNAWFNLVRLGAGVDGYLVDHYGPMADGINAGDESDRLLAVWDVAAPRPAVTEAGPAHVVVEVPDDVEALRVQDPPAARRWRYAVRERLAPLLEGGGHVVGFVRGKGYVVEVP